MSVSSIILDNNTLNLTLPQFATVTLSGPAGDVPVPPIGSTDVPLSAAVDKFICVTGHDLRKTFLYTDAAVQFASGLTVTVNNDPQSKKNIILSDGINSATLILSKHIPTPEYGTIVLNNDEMNMSIVKYATLTFSGPAGEFDVNPIGPGGPISAAVDTILGKTRDQLVETYIFQRSSISFGAGLGVTGLGPSKKKDEITLDDGTNKAVFVLVE